LTQHNHLSLHTINVESIGFADLFAEKSKDLQDTLLALQAAKENSSSHEAQMEALKQWAQSQVGTARKAADQQIADGDF
jgi:D-ribose pyranose/furanose isomerase RbsD